MQLMPLAQGINKDEQSLLPPSKNIVPGKTFSAHVKNHKNQSIIPLQILPLMNF